MCRAVVDGDVIRSGSQHCLKSIHVLRADILQGDVEVDGFTEVELVVVVLVVEYLAVENDVRTIGWDDAHHSLVAEVVLTRHDKVDFGGRQLR